MKEFSQLIIKILTYQPNGENMIIEWLLSISLIIFLMVVLFKIWRIVKKAFQDSLYSGDDDYIDHYIDLDLDQGKVDLDIEDVLSKYYDDGGLI